MLNEPHYPSKWSVAIVFLIILLLIVGIFAWAFFLNFGLLRIQAEQNFELTVNNESYSCLKLCEIRLPPSIYEVVARSNGYYDQVFSVEVQRWGEIERVLSFQIIPYLKPVSENIPGDSASVFIRSASGVKNLYVKTADEERLVTSFASLQDPKVRTAQNTALVIDAGRVFFVDLANGRKIQRFDETVEVKDAFISDDDQRILFFVRMQDTDFIWLWDQVTSQVTPLTWYEAPERVQWDFGVHHRIFVLSNQLNDPTQASLLDEVIDSTSPERSVALFQYNLDRQQAQNISTFVDKIPQEILRRGDRFFVKYQDETFEELVAK